MLLRHDRDLGILATDIAHCTVMFCSLSNAGGRNAQTRLVSADVANFQRLHAVYLDFDQAVRESPLYKYQHVRAWYIIICPNAAEPFAGPSGVSDAENNVWSETGVCGTGSAACSMGEAEQPAQRSATRSCRHTPQTYASEMVMLASRLLVVAQRHGFDLQVGMHAGTAAGAVIGKLRAFYCVYGNTVNMASRLCKSAAAGQVQASMDFMACLEDERGRGVAGRGGELAWHSRGQVT